MAEEVDYNKEYKIYNNALKLLKARGYTVPEGEDLVSQEQFRSIYENTLMKIEVFGHETEPKSIALCLNVQRGTTITDKTIESLTAQAHKNCNGMIIITKSIKKNGAIAVDNKALDIVKMANQTKFRIEFFKEENLMFSLLEHELVPQHKLITEEEKQALLQKYKVKDTQLPKILLTDPVAEYLGLRKGDVVKITRRSETAGTYITYRIASTN